MPPKKDPVSQLANEESAVNGPVRRSTRLSINAINSPAPAPAAASIRGRRASQTDTTTTAKVSKSRRLSQAVDEPKEIEVKPAARGRRASLLVDEENKQPASPRKTTRATRAVSKSPSVEKEPAKRGRRPSTASVESTEEAAKTTTRAKKIATEDSPPKTPVKATRGRRSSVSKVEEVEKEPPKVSTRGRRSSVSKENEVPDEEVPKKTTTRGRRASVDAEDTPSTKPVGRRRRSIAEEEITEAAAKSTPVKRGRRPSVTENLVNMDPIEENEEAAEKDKIKLTPMKKKTDYGVVDPNLSIISENEDTDSSPKPKLSSQKSVESTDLSEIKTPDKTSSSPNKPSEIVSGSDGSFVFNLNVSIPISDKTDLSEKTDLNTSKCSNSSDKENEAMVKNTPNKKELVVSVQDVLVMRAKVENSMAKSIKEQIVEDNQQKEKSMSDEFEFELPSDNDEADSKTNAPKSPIIHSTRASLSKRLSTNKTEEKSPQKSPLRLPSPFDDPPAKIGRKSPSHTSPHQDENEVFEQMEVDDVFEEQVEVEEPQKETNKSTVLSESDTFCDMSKLVVEESDADEGSQNLTEEEEDKLLEDPEGGDALPVKDYEEKDPKSNKETKNKPRLSLEKQPEVKENGLNQSASSTEEITLNTEETDASIAPRISIGKEEKRKSLNVSNLLTECQEIKINGDEKSRLSINGDNKIKPRNSLSKISPNAKESKDETLREKKMRRNSANIEKMLPADVITNGVTEVHNVSVQLDNPDILKLNESKKTISDNDKSVITNGLDKTDEKIHEKLDAPTKLSETVNLDKTENKLNESTEELSDNVSSLSSDSPVKPNENLNTSEAKPADEIDLNETKSRKSLNSTDLSSKNDEEPKATELDTSINEDEEMIEKRQEKETNKSRHSLNASKLSLKNEKIKENGLDSSVDKNNVEEKSPEKQKSRNGLNAEEPNENRLNTSLNEEKTVKEPKENGLDASFEEDDEIEYKPKQKNRKSRSSLNTNNLSSKPKDEPKVIEPSLKNKEMVEKSPAKEMVDEHQQSPEKQDKRKSRNASKLSSRIEEPRGNGLNASLNEEAPKQKSPEKDEVNEISDELKEDNIEDTPKEESPLKEKRKSQVEKETNEKEVEEIFNDECEEMEVDEPEPSPEKQQKRKSTLNASKLSSSKVIELEENDQEEKDDESKKNNLKIQQKRKSRSSLNASKFASKKKENDDQEADDEPRQKIPEKQQKRKSRNSLSSKKDEVSAINDEEVIEETPKGESPLKEKRKSRSSINASKVTSEVEEETNEKEVEEASNDECEEMEVDEPESSPEKKQKGESRASLNASRKELKSVENDQDEESKEKSPEKQQKRKSRSSLIASKLASKKEEEFEKNDDNKSEEKSPEKQQKRKSRNSISSKKIEETNESVVDETQVEMNTSPTKQSKLQQLEDFANSKLDEYLQFKSLDFEDNEESSEDDSYDPENNSRFNEFIDDMAEECDEEESEYDDSNDIPCEGESIGSSDEDLDDEDDEYEDDSFICDEECDDLLSGDEFDLGDKKKSKKSRIVKVDDSSDDDFIDSEKEKTKQGEKYTVVKGEKGEIIRIGSKKEKKSPKPSRIICVNDSSDDEELKNMRKEAIEILDNSEFVDEISYAENTPKEQIKNPALDNVAENTDPGKRRASITIQENIKVDDIKDVALSERINLVVESFCSTVQKGEISMNLSLQYDSPSVEFKPDTTNVDQKIPSPRKRKSTSDSETSFNKKSRTSSGSAVPFPSTSKLNTSLENVKKKKNIKKRLSRSLEAIPIEKPKNKKKTKLKSSQVDDLRVDTFSLMGQELITDIKNRKRRMIKPSMADPNCSWFSEKQPVIKPSTSQLTKAEKQKAIQQTKMHAKDFKNQMLYDKSRVNRVETKTLLKKKGAY